MSNLPLSEKDAVDLRMHQERFAPLVAASENADFLKLAEEIGETMMSTRMECLVILSLFGADKERIMAFLRVAEGTGTLKPATLPSLLLNFGEIGEDKLKEINVINVLAA